MRQNEVFMPIPGMPGMSGMPGLPDMNTWKGVVNQDKNEDEKPFDIGLVAGIQI